MTYIEQLLAKFDDIEAKAQFNGLIEKNSFLGDYIVDPVIRTKTEEISQWAETEWDYDHGMSKREWQQEQELADYKQRLEAAGNKKMKTSELEDLDVFLGNYIKTNGLLTKTEVEAQIKLKEDAFNQELNVIGRLATRVPYLNAKYQKEFGEMFDPDVFVKEASEKGFAAQGVDGLDKYYNEFTRDKTEAKRQSDIASAVAQAKLDGAKEERQRLAAESPSGMPTLEGSPEMSHFESKIRKMNAPVDANASAAPADAELGRGTIARFAALRGDALERQGRVN